MTSQQNPLTIPVTVIVAHCSKHFRCILGNPELEFVGQENQFLSELCASTQLTVQNQLEQAVLICDTLRTAVGNDSEPTTQGVPDQPIV